MTRLELLALQMHKEAGEHEIKSVQTIFGQNIAYWKMCMDAAKLLEEKKARIKNAPDISRKDSQVAN